MDLKQKTVMFFATGAWLGKIPVAPGTFGTIPGLLLCFILSGIDLCAAILCAVIFILFAVWISHLAEKIMGEKDPGSIVIDEIAGMAVTLLGHPFTPGYAVAGFFIFRFFDILKPWPIRFLDKKIPGGIGIVVDDVAAGVFGNIVLILFRVFI